MVAENSLRFWCDHGEEGFLELSDQKWSKGVKGNFRRGVAESCGCKRLIRVIRSRKPDEPFGFCTVTRTGMFKVYINTVRSITPNGDLQCMCEHTLAILSILFAVATTSSNP